MRGQALVKGAAFPSGGAGSVVDVRMLGNDPVVLSGNGGGLLLVRYTTPLGIQSLADDVPPAYYRPPYRFPPAGRNGLPPYHWDVASVGLPPRLTPERHPASGD